MSVHCRTPSGIRRTRDGSAKSWDDWDVWEARAKNPKKADNGKLTMMRSLNIPWMNTLRLSIINYYSTKKGKRDIACKERGNMHK